MNYIKQTQDQLNQNKIWTSKKWRNKILTILSNPDTEREFRAACSLYESSAYYERFRQNYLEYINLYHKITSLYLIYTNNRITKLIIYDTESENKEEKILNSPEPLDGACVAQLPNGELFCLGKSFRSGITLIIDTKYNIRVLPSNTRRGGSSCIYLNENIYCFGGYNDNYLTLASKFDLNKNRWINLTPMPKADYFCHSVIFNGDILFSRCLSRNLLLYSVEIDSFSTIPYDFAESKIKILINIEKLYLIECGGLIYESEVGNEYVWIQIANSIISDKYPSQVYYSYNKGGIYISTMCNDGYYKFDLNQKTMIKLQ